MKNESVSESQPALFNSLERYYEFHAKIYNATRWTFLFGREALIKKVKALANPKRILEVGCGTGFNITRLCKTFPEAFITGLDRSSAMLEIARDKTKAYANRVELLHQSYSEPVAKNENSKYDLIIFSYALSMFTPQPDHAISMAANDLKSGAFIAVIDFHDSSFTSFKKWMRMNHVRMDSHLQPVLQKHFEAKNVQIHPAYFGMWNYLTFIGQNKNATT